MTRLCALLLLAFSSLSLSASPLAVYDFKTDKHSGQTANAPSPEHRVAGVEASPLEWVAPEEIPSGFGGRFATAFINGMTRGFQPDRYLTFTIKAEAGQKLDLQSLSLVYGASVSNLYEGEPFEAQLQVSSDASPVAFEEAYPISPAGSREASVMIEPVPSVEGVYHPLEVDLSAINGRASVTFRIYLYSRARSSAIFLRLQEIRVNGVVVQP